MNDIEIILSDLHTFGYYEDTQHMCGFSLSGDMVKLDLVNSIHSGKTAWLGKHVAYFYELNSTNDILSKLAESRAPEGTTVLAENQTAGRGRAGRSWEVPAGSGLLFSFLLYPKIEAENVPLLTLAAAVGVAKGILKATGIHVGIKWPNDLIVQGKKLGGILSEARFTGNHVEHVIIGTGINVNNMDDQWSEDLRKSAVSLRQLTGSLQDRQRIFDDICSESEKVFNNIYSGNSEAVVNEWVGLSVTLGKEVNVHTPKGSFQAYARGISPQGALIIQKKSGEIESIFMGEISIRHEL